MIDNPASYEARYTHIVNLTPKKVVRTTATITATVLLTKLVTDVAGEVAKPYIARWARKLEMNTSERARDKITEKDVVGPVEAKDDEPVKATTKPRIAVKKAAQYPANTEKS